MVIGGERMITISVDDKIAAARMIADKMKKLDPDGVHEVENDPQRAIERIEQLHPDIVWLDIEMSVMNGLEIKSVSLVLEGYNAAHHGAGAETAGLLGDLLSSGQQLVGMLSHSMILFGAWSVMKKTGDDTLSQKCRVYALIYLSAGILMLLSDGAEYLVSRLNPEAADSLSVETIAVVAVNIFMTAAASFIGIPAFLAFRKVCMAVYTLLFHTREG